MLILILKFVTLSVPLSISINTLIKVLYVHRICPRTVLVPYRTVPYRNVLFRTVTYFSVPSPNLAYLYRTRTEPYPNRTQPYSTVPYRTVLYYFPYSNRTIFSARTVIKTVLEPYLKPYRLKGKF